MDRISAMRLFVRVVESGSFAAAAREAGIGQPAVSKQIIALEAHLGAQLILRTSRSMVLTDAGQIYYESSVRLIEEFYTVESLIGTRHAAPSGLVRISVAPVFGRRCVVPRLPTFFSRYPDIAVELSGSERLMNLIEDGLDLAVRIGETTDSSMTIRKLGMAPFVTVATPAYVRANGSPASPAQLADHACIVFLSRSEVRPWKFSGPSGLTVHLPRGNFRTADAEQVQSAALAGLGIAHGPDYLFASEIASVSS
jgi:LysR family transcriptional regulator for bpeEF and oprC